MTRDVPSPTDRWFSARYLEHVTLTDGSAATLRRVTPDDARILARGFARLSPESRYARFFSPKAQLTERELTYLTCVDHERHFALGALADDPDEPDGARGLGIARFIVLGDSVDGPDTVAEAAIAVADDAQGRGLGRLLFLRLCAAARERGVECFRCEVLCSNTAMRRLIEGLFPEHELHVEQGVMTIDMRIPDVAPTTPLGSPAPEGGLYALLRAAAANTVDWTAAVRRLWTGDER